MATIRENRKNGKIVSYRFTACLERDARGKQVRKYTTWTPPSDLTPAKAKRAAERAAMEWEDEIRAEHQEQKEAAANGTAYSLPPEKRQDDFTAFIKDIWLPLQIQSGNRKATTVVFYENLAKVITRYFDGAVMQEISPMQIQRYLIYLRTEYKSVLHKPLSAKSVRHHYTALHSIFSYAERNGFIAKNPMTLVERPKKEQKPVDALTVEQARQFFACLSDCPLDFRCVLLLLLTTGMRRGECMGLKWKDIDEAARLVRIERNVTYTPKSGVLVDTPKTVNSIRTVPLMESVVLLLQEYKREMQAANPDAALTDAFLFPKEGNIFQARDPNSVTRRVKRFMRLHNLPDLSPHDLRHPYVKYATTLFCEISKKFSLPWRLLPALDVCNASSRIGADFFEDLTYRTVHGQIYLALTHRIEVYAVFAEEAPVERRILCRAAKPAQIEHQHHIHFPSRHSLAKLHKTVAKKRRADMLIGRNTRHASLLPFVLINA